MISLPEIGLGDCQFEDWYVHPDLVDMKMINYISQKEPIHFKDIISKIKDYNSRPSKDENYSFLLSEGEILDRYSILDIKSKKITNII